MVVFFLVFPNVFPNVFFVLKLLSYMYLMFLVLSAEGEGQFALC